MTRSRARRGAGIGRARSFPALLALLVGMAVAMADPAAAMSRSLEFYFTHTGERLKVVYKRGGRYVPSALNEINRFLRDWRRNESTKMDPELLDLLWHVYRDVGASEPIHVVSAYRSPATNNMLRRRSRGVAKFSLHMAGKAIDFYIPGVKSSRIREAAFKRQVGGVGYYPRSSSAFVHLDTGSVRSWPRMSRSQLARLFPDGKTLHLPADGKPLKNYEAAKAAEKAGRLARLGGGGGGLLAFARGGGGGGRRGAADSLAPSGDIVRPAGGNGSGVVTALIDSASDRRDVDAAVERATDPIRPQPRREESADDATADDGNEGFRLPRLASVPLPQVRLPSVGIGDLVGRFGGDDSGSESAQEEPARAAETRTAALPSPGASPASVTPRERPDGDAAETAEADSAETASAVPPPLPRPAPTRPEETPAQPVAVASSAPPEETQGDPGASVALGYADPATAGGETPAAALRQAARLVGDGAGRGTGGTPATRRASTDPAAASGSPATAFATLPAGDLLAAPDREVPGILDVSDGVDDFAFARLSHPDRHAALGGTSIALSSRLAGTPGAFRADPGDVVRADRFERPSIVIFARRDR